MKLRQGFGAIEIIVIITLLVIVGGLGWYALGGKAKEQSSASPSPSTQVTTNSSNNTKSTQASPSSSEPYLEIKELGIKMKLTTKILDIEYSYDAASKKASFGSKSLTTLAKQSSSSQCYVQAGPLGWITQQSQAFPANQNKPADKDIKLLGGSYYGFFTPDVGCPGGVASNGEALQKLSGEQLSEVTAAVQILELIK